MNPLESLLGGLLGGNAPAQGGAALGGAAGPLLQMAMQMLAGQGGGGAGGGLGALMQQFQQAGLGGHMDSWISTGQNLPISPEQLMQVLGQGQVQQMAAASGMDTSEVAGGLSQILPQLIDKLTPGGQVPSGGLDSALAELSQMMPRS
jgi:uncharacterized protein YidB (DUF937 family)